ncbi:MAG: D-tyrosyl-tRNA(Tyr) deacylase [Chlamydiales bacterium]|nr:D-tyrosyl-tRNA(Tyr) deacylase [Chlamydiales bacterium]
MKAVIQRVSRAHVSVDHHIVGKIEAGLLVLLGVQHGDTSHDVKWLAEKIAVLRIFTDENDKMNLSVKDVQGGVLVISQFTLYGNCQGGRRPDFMQAAKPEHAIPLYEEFLVKMGHALGYPVEAGRFGADMQVHLVNDGPVTLIIESKSKT